jgi:hypothetical protein
MSRYLPKAIAITTLCAVFAGCASTSDLDAVKADLARVEQTANEAKALAAQANTNAEMANSKIDRAFKRAAQK